MGVVGTGDKVGMDDPGSGPLGACVLPGGGKQRERAQLHGIGKTQAAAAVAAQSGAAWVMDHARGLAHRRCVSL